MDAIDPLKSAPLQGLPMTDEIAMKVKAKVKEAKMETTDTSGESEDVSDLSPEAARLSKPQFEAFLDVAKDQILQMDRDSDTYLPDATQKLVTTALERKFGEKFANDPGFQQMEGKLTSYILNDPETRSMVEGMLELIHLENKSA
jgi:hypothetical protein